MEAKAGREEGGFAPDLASNEEALSVIMQAVENAGYKMEQDIKAAAVKVKAFRDSADADGGVYPTPTKSGAPEFKS